MGMWRWLGVLVSRDVGRWFGKRAYLIATLSLCGAACATTSPARSTYAILLERDRPVGTVYRRHSTIQTHEVSVLEVDGKAMEQEVEDGKLTLEALVERLPSSPDGESRHKHIILQLSEEKDGQTHDLVVRGTTVTTQDGTPELNIVAGELSDRAVAAFNEFVSPEDAGGPSDDEVFGSIEQRAVGESWPINADLVAKSAAEEGLTLDPKAVSGTTTLVRATEVEGVECLELEGTVSMSISGLPDLPPSSVLEEQKIESEVGACVPTAPDVLSPREKQSMAITTVMSLVGDEGHQRRLRVVSEEVHDTSYRKIQPLAPEAARLIEAAMKGDVATIETLAGDGVGLEQGDIVWGNTPLFFAAGENQPDAVTALLRLGARGDAKNNVGITALGSAASMGHAATVTALLDGGVPVDQTNSEGTTALHLALARGHTKIVELLLERGADPKYADASGSTPLMVAADARSVDLVKTLLARGAEVNARNSRGATALHTATAEETAPTNLELVALLLDAGAEPDAADANATTALMFAAFYGNADLARLLIDKGVDINRRDDHQHATALHVSLARKHPKVSQVLIEAGADSNLLTKSGVHPLSIAVQFGFADIVKAMLARGVAPDEVGKSDPALRPLMVAAYNQPSLVPILLEAGAKADFADPRGITPLHLVASTKSPEAVSAARALIEAGADKSAKDGQDMTPLDIARKYSSPEMVQMLESAEKKPPARKKRKLKKKRARGGK